MNTLADIPILLFYLNKNQKYVSTFSILYKWTPPKSSLQLLQSLGHGIQKKKSIFCTSEALLCFTQKNNFCIMNKIKLVWFYSLYRNYFFSKNVIFLHILKIIFTMLRLKIFLEYWIILCISRKLLCVKGSLHATIFWIYTELFNILKIFLSLT